MTPGPSFLTGHRPQPARIASSQLKAVSRVIREALAAVFPKGTRHPWVPTLILMLCDPQDVSLTSLGLCFSYLLLTVVSKEETLVKLGVLSGGGGEPV